MAHRPDRSRHARTARLVRRSVLPLLVLGTVVAVVVTATGGLVALRVAAFAVLACGIAAAVASDVDARADRLAHAAERARLAAGFAQAHQRLVREHADATDELTVRFTARVRRLRDHLAQAKGATAQSRLKVLALGAELVSVRAELDRVTRARDALRADVAAYVAIETARLAAADQAAAQQAAAELAAADQMTAEAVVVAPAGVVDLGSWERRATG